LKSEKNPPWLEHPLSLINLPLQSRALLNRSAHTPRFILSPSCVSEIRSFFALPLFELPRVLLRDQLGSVFTCCVPCLSEVPSPTVQFCFFFLTLLISNPGSLQELVLPPSLFPSARGHISLQKQARYFGLAFFRVMPVTPPLMVICTTRLADDHLGASTKCAGYCYRFPPPVVLPKGYQSPSIRSAGCQGGLLVVTSRSSSFLLFKR